MATREQSITISTFQPIMTAVTEAHDMAEAVRLGFVAGHLNPNDIDFEAMSNVCRLLLQRLDTATAEIENIFSQKEKGVR